MQETMMKFKTIQDNIWAEVTKLSEAREERRKVDDDHCSADDDQGRRRF
jgi:hypothetical protein